MSLYLKHLRELYPLKKLVIYAEFLMHIEQWSGLWVSLKAHSLRG